MPTYIYVHPDTNEEIEIFHSISEVKNPSKNLLKKITLEDGRIMKRKIVAPALIGFDNLGRSIRSSDEKANGTEKPKQEKKETKKETKKAV